MAKTKQEVDMYFKSIRVYQAQQNAHIEKMA